MEPIFDWVRRVARQSSEENRVGSVELRGNAQIKTIF